MGPTKYVVGIHGLFVEAVIFPERLNHNEVGPAVFGSRDKIVSAGFCYLDNKTNKMVVYGKSTSLKIEGNPELDRYLLDVAMGIRQRLDVFDDEKPPFGTHTTEAETLILKRTTEEAAKNRGS